MGLAALYHTYNCFTGFLILCISLHPALSAVVQDPFASKNPFGNVGVKSPMAGSTFFEVSGWPGGKPPGASTPNPTGLAPPPIKQPATGPPNPTLTAKVSPQLVSGSGRPQVAATPANPSSNGWPASVSGTQQIATKWSNPYRPGYPTPGSPQPVANPSNQARNGWPTPGSPQPVANPSNQARNGWPASMSGTQQVTAKSSNPPRSGWPGRPTSVSGAPQQAVGSPNSSTNNLPTSMSRTQQVAAKLSNRFRTGWPRPGTPQQVAKPSNQPLTGLPTSVSGSAQPAAGSSKFSPNGWPSPVPGIPQPAAKWSPTSLVTETANPTLAAPVSQKPVSGSSQPAAGSSQFSPNGWSSAVPGMPQPATKWSPSGSVAETANPTLSSPVSLQPVPGSPQPAATPQNPNGWPQSVPGTPQQAAQPSNPFLSGWPTSVSGTHQPAAGPYNLAPGGWPTSVPGTPQPTAKWSPTGLAPVSPQPASGSMQQAARPPNPHGWPTSVSGTPQQAAQPSGPILTGWPTVLPGTPQQTAVSSPHGWPTSVPGTQQQQPAASGSPTGLVPETANPTQQRIRAVPRPFTKTTSDPSTNKSFRNVWAARLASRNPQKTPVVSNPTLKDGSQKQIPLIIATKMLQSGSLSATSAPKLQPESKQLSADWDIKATLSKLSQTASKQVTGKNAEQQQLRPSNSISSSGMPTPTKRTTEPSQTRPQQVSTEPNPVSKNVIQSAIDMVQKVQGAAGAQSSKAISTPSKTPSFDIGTLKQLSSVISNLTRHLESSLAALNNTAKGNPKRSPQTALSGSSLPNVNTPTSVPSLPSSQPIITETLNQPIVTNAIPPNRVNADIPAPVTEMPNMFNPLTETPGASNLQSMPISMADMLRSRFVNPGLATQSETGPANKSPSSMLIETIAESPPTAPPTEVINTNQLPSNPNALTNMNLPPVATGGSEPKTTNQNTLGDVLSIFSTSGNPPVTISESSYGTIPIATESPFTVVPSTAINAVTALAEKPLNQAATEATSQAGVPVEQAGPQTGNPGSLMDRFASALNPVTPDQTTLVETPLNPAATEMPLEQFGTRTGPSMNPAAANPTTPVDQTTFVETSINPAPTSPIPTEMPVEPAGTVTTVGQTTLAESPLNPAATTLTPTEMPIEPAGTVTAVGQTTLAETPINPARLTPTEMPIEAAGTVTAIGQTTLAEKPLNPAATSLTQTEMPVETQSGPSAQQVSVNPSTPRQVMNPDQSLNTVTETVGNPSWQTNNVVNNNQIYPDPNTSSGPLRNEQMVVGNNPFETSNKIVLSPAAATIPGSPIAQTLNTGFAGQAAPKTPISETANPSQQGTMPNFSPDQWDALRMIMAAFPQLSPTALLQGVGAIPVTSITQAQPAVAPPPSTMPPQSTSAVEPQPAATQSQTVYQSQSTVQAPIEGQTQQVVTVQVA